MSDLETFRAATRAWLEAECPPEMREPVVGDDDRSRAWLERRGPALRRMQAVGLVVNVAQPQALAALRRMVPGLTLMPVSGDDLARRLGIHHYPLLITADGVEP